jgi:serine/threonine-protein kinase
VKALGDIGAGHTLGRYELLVPIAQGGMAVVWAARMKGTRGFQKIVAVKSMLPSLSEDPQFEEMFLAEAELASRIKHPHVCEILDLGEEDGTLYIVMEWVDGEPLSAIQKAARQKGGVPLHVATRIGLAAAMGLHAAHELKNDDGELVGLVHRDVSPQNILVTYDGVVKIVDFGVAKATADADQGRTRAGQVKGKVPFMSPEQALGKKVDRRTDVFALGIVLYQMVAGKHPFRGETDMATMNRICEKEPVAPVKSLVPTVPDSLSNAIGTALEKDVSKRFQTMTELARALERAMADVGGEARGTREEDVAAFVKSVVGDRSDKRKAAIKEAIRLAETRTQGKKSDASGAFPALARPTLPSDPMSGSDVSEVSHVSVQSGHGPSISGVTGVPTSIEAGKASRASSPGHSSATFVVPDRPATPASGVGGKTAIAVGVVLVGLGVAAGMMLVSRSPDPAPAAAPTYAPSAPVEAPPPAAPAAQATATSTPTLDEPEAIPFDAIPAGGDSAASAKPKVGGAPRPTAAAKPKATSSAAPAATGPRVPQVRDPGF